MHESWTSSRTHVYWRGFFLFVLTYALAFAVRMVELPVWFNAEYRLGTEWLLSTHDAYHWVAGAEGFEFGAGHPMSELLRWLADFSGFPPAHVAFWLPPIMASFVASLVFCWAWALGYMELGVCAGVLASLAPGFLARTLLGYCDTDLVTLLFPLLMGLGPVCWCMRFCVSPWDFLCGLWKKYIGRTMCTVDAAQNLLADDAEKNGHAPKSVWGTLQAFSSSYAAPLRPLWLLCLSVSAMLGWWSQEWHSMFPYVVRCNIALIGFIALFLCRSGQRRPLLLGALAYAFPALLGSVGLIFPVFLLLTGGKPGRKLLPLFSSVPVLCLLWISVLLFFFDQNILQEFWMRIASYTKKSGDPAVTPGLVYPSVAQSIVEIQDLSLYEIPAYFHPWTWFSVLGILGYALLLLRTTGAFFLLPMLVLGLLSLKMGGRMVMFGAPVIALGLALPLGTAFVHALRENLRGFWSSLIISLAILGLLGEPFVKLIPEMTNGPMINRRHAEGLAHARSSTPKDAMLWLWWDWGYATHHFAQRATIADGAAHGGPSLYIPAAVFATDSPRFARQLIKYTASKGNVPGNVLNGLTPSEAESLITMLRSPETPLIQAEGKQYIVLSFSMLRLGFWISTFGNWDFNKKEGKGNAISIVPQQLSYNLESGEVVMQGKANSIFAFSIDVFEDGKLIRKDYTKTSGATWNEVAGNRKTLSKRRNIHFLFDMITQEKLIMDDRLYNALMVQLLLCAPDDPRFAPYFRLTYDNVFCRIYEVL